VGRAFEAAPRRGVLADRLLGVFLMAVTGALALASLVIGIATAVVQRAAEDVLGRTPGGGWVVSVLGFVLPLVLIFVAFWVIYRVVPNRQVTFREVLPGAVVATALWTLLRIGFTYYATNIARYDSAFGPISTGITLLVFLYFASVIVLLGAEFARASVLDAEERIARQAESRVMPMPLPPDAGLEPLSVRRRGPPRWVLLAGGALIGLVAGRLSKRDEDDE
ncbi:MAG: YihY/virulence factor BrkB family protein, partial [Candidatus Limnocylindria bacterium]